MYARYKRKVSVNSIDLSKETTIVLEKEIKAPPLDWYCNPNNSKPCILTIGAKN